MKKYQFGFSTIYFIAALTTFFLVVLLRAYGLDQEWLLRKGPGFAGLTLLTVFISLLATGLTRLKGVEPLMLLHAIFMMFSLPFTAASYLVSPKGHLQLPGGPLLECAGLLLICCLTADALVRGIRSRPYH